MRGIDVGALRLMELASRHRLKEIERIRDGRDDLVVFVGGLRVLDPRKVPVFRVVKIGKPAINQRAYKVQRERRTLVPAQYHLWVGDAIVGRKA